MKLSRRNFVIRSSQLALGVGLMGCAGASTEDANTSTEDAATELFFDISLAQWSLHQDLFDGKLDNLDFAMTAKKEFDIHAVEYVNGFFKDKAKDKDYINEMKKRAADHGVKSLLVMIDNEGDLGNTDDAARKTAVENHYKWVEAAQQLGCHSIRVNAFGEGTREEVAAAAVDGLGSLATFAKDYNINVLVENHGGYSSDGQWMMGVMNTVNMANCGMLPDFGNFCVARDGGKRWEGDCIDTYDKYKGVEEFMPKAIAVSAKSYDFDEAGDETTIDFKKMLQIIKAANYTGFIGVEYEGKRLSPYEGIRATKALLERAGKEV